MLRDDQDGWDGGVGGQFKRVGIYVCTYLIQFIYGKKLTQHCKTIIFQFLKK